MFIKMKRTTFFLRTLIVFLLLFSFSVSVAENLPLKILKDYPKDLSFAGNYLLHKKNYVVSSLLFIGGTFFADKSINEFTLHHQSTMMTRMTNVTNNFGNPYYTVPPTLLLGTAGYIFKDEKLFGASLISLESAVTASVLSTAFKGLFGRGRPFVTDNPLNFKPFSSKFGFTAFPSGHTTFAWATFTPFAEMYHLPVLYLIPLSVNVARIYKNKHWFSDTVAGSLLGFGVGYLFSKSHEKSDSFFIISYQNGIFISHCF